MMPEGPGTGRANMAARTTIRRDTDRRITAGGLLISAGFLLVALASALLPSDMRRGVWLPLHLALPGAASVAIGTVLPFFLAALGATRPGAPWLRIATIGLLAAGAAGVAAGFAAGVGIVATAGGVLFIGGLVGLGALLVTILGGALGPQRGLLPRAYAWAIADVLVGASLATLYVAGWAPIVSVWGQVKPAHAWLNVFGFVGLVIASTLVHLYPTVLGTRIGLRPSVRVALVGLGGGPSAIALGYLLAAAGHGGLGAVVARLGALTVVVGALSLVRFAAEAHAARGRWTTDFAWHRFTSWSLALGVGWYVVGLGVAAARVLVLGVEPVGWGIELVGAPLAIGFILQILVGSWTHLLPSVGPGDQRVHARQRTVLARGTDGRLVLLNAGVAILAVALPLASGAGAVGSDVGANLVDAGVVAGAMCVVVALGAGLALLLRAVLLRPDPPPDPLR